VGKELRNGLPVYRVPLLPRGQGSALRLALNYGSFVISASSIGLWLLRRQKFDVVFVYAISPITQGIAGWIFSRFKKTAHVIWVQDLWPESLKATGFVKNDFLLSVVGAVTSWIYRRAHMLLAQSPALKEEVRGRAPRVEVRYHPNPAERAFSITSSAEAPVISLKPGFNILFAGNLGTAQSLPTILDAAALLASHADIRFTIAGSGSMSGWLQNTVKQRALNNVEFVGRFSSSAMPGIFAQASALLVTLIRDEMLEKIIPSKVATCLAAGRPIVASIDGEGAKVIRDSHAGFAVPAQDARALADAILRLSSVPVSERDAIGQAGREYYERHFEPNRLADQLVEHFADAIRIRSR
jgi:glycosyltransferase involved in cell wall biosynthesis